jgi:uncharacterized protein YyaL (SSP411 family)
VNHLAAEKSPYLLQHAGNPVDWYPWGEEAFRRARADNRPVFLSIGYATCHWCHVMAHESFEDERVAALMNAVFVSIKVDREERPDLDEHFMNVCQLLTGSGGWPLTVVLTPEGKPFFAGTYIPRENAYGRMGMMELVPAIADLWSERRDDVDASVEEIARALAGRMQQEGDGIPIDAGAVLRAADGISRHYDSRNGGFGSAPKFPMPVLSLLLLRAWDRSRDSDTRAMVEKSLTAMRNGGIYDQVGFGFHRYSTDAFWRVPHFEKMLYDQALLLLAYCETWQAAGSDPAADGTRGAAFLMRMTSREIATYVLRDMTSPEGAFYSAEDADSEGEEGKFYTWTEAELPLSLSVEERAELQKRYGTFGTARGILFRDPADTSPPGRIESALLHAREGRVRPLRDDKVLADWNGLMIAALSRAGGAFDEPSLVHAAGKAARFVLDRMSPGGRLLHRYRDGEAAIPAFAEDLAFLAWGLLEHYEASFEVPSLKGAVAQIDALLAHHWDQGSGGFFRTADDAEALPGGRSKPLHDGVIPSANSVALLVLLRLARITGNSDYQGKAESIIRLYPAEAVEDAYSHAVFLAAVDFAAGPTYEVVIAGDPEAEDTRAMVREIRRRFLPRKVLLFRPANVRRAEISEIAAFTDPLAMREGKATAYVCRNHACELPTSDVGRVLELLGAG